MKKVLFVMGSLVLSLGALFGFSGSASADTNSFSFATELDYMDDNKIRASSGQTIKININSCSRVNWNNMHKTPMSVSDCASTLSVKLCNLSTGNCTSSKKIGSDGFVTFANMKGATYTAYFSGGWSGYYFEGRSTASSY